MVASHLLTYQIVKFCSKAVQINFLQWLIYIILTTCIVFINMKLLRLIMYIIFMFEIKRIDLLWIMLYRYWGLSFPEFSFDLHRQWGVVWGPSGIRGVSLSPERGHPRTGEQLRGKLWVWVTEQLPRWSKTKTTSSGKRAIPISFR